MCVICFLQSALNVKLSLEIKIASKSVSLHTSKRCIIVQCNIIVLLYVIM